MLLCSLVAWGTFAMVHTQTREDWPKSLLLSDVSNFTIYWDPSPDNNGKLHFLITARTRGYIGFGLSETGTMAGADLLIAWPENATHFVLKDLYAAQNGLPCEDHRADWQLEVGVWQPDAASINSDIGTLKVQLARSLNTGDQEDLPIKREMFILYSWGEKRELEYHGSAQRGARKLRLLDSATSVSSIVNFTSAILLLYLFLCLSVRDLFVHTLVN